MTYLLSPIGRVGLVVARLAQESLEPDSTASESISAAGRWLGHAAAVGAIVVAAWLFTRLIRMTLRWGIGRLADRARAGRGTHWRVRLPRVGGETDDVAMLRRDHRVDATVLVFSRIASVIVWMVALLFALSYAGVDIVLAVSGAGFVGFAVAIGGQHTIHDAITGVHILLEDRFSEGDEVSVRTLAGSDVVGRVTSIGVFSTRIEGDSGTYHLANHTLDEVCNRSQRGVPSEIEFDAEFDTGESAAVITHALRDTYDEITRGHLIIDEITPAPTESDESSRYRVAVRTRRALSGEEHESLTRGVQRRVGAHRER